MTVPHEFAFRRHGKEIVTIPNCILDLVTNHLVNYMVFVRDIQKPSQA